MNITKVNLEAIRANIIQQRDQAVGALAVLDHLLGELEAKPAVESEELESMIGAKLMGEPKPLEAANDGKNSK